MEAFFEFEKPIVTLEKRLRELRELAKSENVDFGPEMKALESKMESLIDEVYARLTPWQRVQLSRHPNRPYAADYLPLIFGDFVELHGDRLFSDDPAIIAGLTTLDDRAVVVVANQKGRNTKQKIERNFGMAKPEGYRKSLRVMKLAAQFHLPIITFIDTPGAFPGLDAEERGQSEAIARCIMEMFGLESPIISCVIGEGGSGGALAVGVADRVLMQEFSIYSVISPESCASILWSDSAMNETAAKIMKMTPEDLQPLGVIDEIVREPKGGAHRDWPAAARLIKKALSKNLEELADLTPKTLLAQRHKKFRQMGDVAIEQPTPSKEDRKEAP
ncbi:MAG: acetyl-CoA carboxylase carboxyltransferase subunit alpha [Deltaproteobacteria bacterium]|nr:acetyl-CoA carboxylase carboxyltransferase subunit alpha [Deltaproteobacteria bacterium]